MYVVAKPVRLSTKVRIVSVHETQPQAVQACPVKGNADVYEVIGNRVLSAGEIAPTTPHAKHGGVLVVVVAD